MNNMYGFDCPNGEDDVRKCGIKVRYHNAEQERILTILSHALPFFTCKREPDNTQWIMLTSPLEAELMAENVEYEGLDYLGRFDAWEFVMGNPALA